jgi:5-methylthioribose kinase
MSPDHYLEATLLEPFTMLLQRGRWIGEDEKVFSVSPAGQGNMNYVWRVRTPQHCFILKQARPWVVKYPQIPAPEERTRQEAKFYEFISPYPAVAERMPHYVGFDREWGVLVLRDLGNSCEATSRYGVDEFTDEEIDSLQDYLRALHHLPFDRLTALDFSNQAMRELNAAHVFTLPLGDPSILDLDAITPGLSAASHWLRTDYVYREALTRLRSLYLGEGRTLLHGDFYPGSWLSTARGWRVIDPEFSYWGCAEFDLGVAAAHLLFCGCPLSRVRRFLEEGSGVGDYDAELASQFAGAELMRRLLGVAQLSLRADLEQKRLWLKLSHAWVLGEGLN